MDHANGEYKAIGKELLNGYNGIIYGYDEEGTKYDYSCTMQKVVFKNGKVISVSGELSSLKNEIIADYSETIKKTDTKTNIKLEATNSTISTNTEMNITEIISGEKFDKIKNNLPQIKSFKVYDIVLSENNEEIQPNGNVKISIPIPEGVNTSKLVVYRIEEDSTKTEYKVTVENGYATFETDHFSTYVLGEKSDETQENVKYTTTEKLPQTGEENNILAKWLTIIIILGILWISSMLLIEYENKKIMKK